MDKKRVFVVGGGASGLIAAIMAAREGAAVTVLEQNEKPGKKLNATGNGKCNLTNVNPFPDAYRGTHPEFVCDALNAFSVADTIHFFSQLGICVVNRNGYLYPRSGQASCVAELLSMEARSLGVKIKTNTRAEQIFQEKQESSTSERQACTVWKLCVPGWSYEADAVVLANGSRASSIPGADGSGYELAASLGHRIVKPLPALTALKCQGKGSSFSAWAGVRAEGEVSLYLDHVLVRKERGELQLTEYGVSGIPVFQLSRYAIRALQENRSVHIAIDFLPEFSAEEAHSLLAMRKKSCPYKTDRELLIGLFPDKLIKVLTAQTEKSREKGLVETIKHFPLKVSGSLSFAQAQVCSGGVDTTQVNSRTMESRLHRGLFFAGELLDIDGACGGYNLQWAWSSGAVAGKAAAGTRSK